MANKEFKFDTDGFKYYHNTYVKSPLNGEKSRAQAAESSLGSAKADKATTLSGYGITDAYTKSETYTKTEVNGLVSTPHQEYVTVATYASLPVSGSKDTIYRVSNYDGSQSQVNTAVYSEYAWNGSQYVFLCVKSQIGEVFDITVYKSNTKYADLASALGTNGDNIPESLRKGGMSVKYVQSSDNKYVQYRNTNKDWSTNENDWRGQDEMTTEETVYTSITGTNQNNGGNAYYIYYIGEIATDSSLFRATLFEIETGKQYCATANIMYSSTALAVFFDSQMNYLGYQGQGNQSTEDHYEKEVLIIPANTKYIGLTNKISDSQTYPLLYKKETKIFVSPEKVIFSDDKTLEKKANEHFSLLSNKRWACVGDSLTALGYTDKHYYDYVAEVTGIIPLNYGISGTGYAKGDNPFYSRISSIPLDVDVITVFGSGNDLSSGKAIGNIDDTNTTTICGCINQTLDNIFDRFPITPLAIVTPTPWRNTDMEDYVNAIVSICKKRGVPVCDLYHCSNMHPDSLTYRELVYSGDEIGGDGTPKGVHSNAIGHKIMAPHFLQTLESVVI